MKLKIVFIITSITGCFYQAVSQDSTPEKLIDGKTTAQIIKEYESWSGMKNDWANLNYYKLANDTLAESAKGETRVVFMGNSITQGWNSRSPEFFSNNSFICRGISGQTTPQMLLRFRQDVLDLNPKAIVILAGINDIAGNTGPSTLEMITDNIFSMIELAKANNIKPVLCSVLPANRFSWRPEAKPADSVIELNQLLMAYAKENKITYVDYYSSMVDNEKGLKKEYSGDGVHPNRDGYAVMEGIILKVLEKVK